MTYSKVMDGIDEVEKKDPASNTAGYPKVTDINQQLTQQQVVSTPSTPSYNSNPGAFQRIDIVSMSLKSQQDLWVGKNVNPILSPSAGGDYWVVTENHETFHIVLKSNAR